MAVSTNKLDPHQARSAFTRQPSALVFTVILLTVVGFATTSQGQACLVAPSDLFDAQIGLAPIATGDFNGDGITDWAGATRNQTVSIFLSDGLGSFTVSEPVLSVGTNALDIEATDFTIDDQLDLIIRRNDGVALYENDGTGVFSFFSMLSTTDIDEFKAGDFNDDGRIDLAISKSGLSDVLIFLADDTGGFIDFANHRVGPHPGLSAITIGYFNNDDILDLAVATIQQFNHEVTIYFGTGTGTFSVAPGDSYFVYPGPRELVTADMDDDGELDLVITSTATDAVEVLRGSRLGGFHLGQNLNQLVARDVAGPTAVADFSGDGIKDVAVTHFSPTRLSILVGDGTGDISSLAGLTAELSTPWHLAAGDFDNSGVSDLIVNNTGNSSFTVLFALGGDEDGDGVCGVDDVCPDADDTEDRDEDGTPNACDECPDDANKVAPRTCGCGVSDFDSDADGVADCRDRCPGGNDRVDSDSDGIPDCLDRCTGGDDRIDADDDDVPDFCDNCPNDAGKTEPGICGCGVSEEDADEDGVVDCEDVCAGSDDKIDRDDDGAPDGCDECPEDAEKTAIGECGCGVRDVDDDADGVWDCDDVCPGGDDEMDGDSDGVPDFCDNCPDTPNEAQEDADRDDIGDACDTSGFDAGGAARTDQSFQASQSAAPPLPCGLGIVPMLPMLFLGLVRGKVARRPRRHPDR